MAFLRGMKLENYKAVSGLSIDFSERLTVLIGENGVGKSSVLEAASLASDVLGRVAEPRGDLRTVRTILGGEAGFHRKVFLEQNPIKLRLQTEREVVELEWQFAQPDYQDSWRLVLETNKAKAELSSDQTHNSPLIQTFRNAVQSLPLSAGYFRFDSNSLAADSPAPTEAPTLSVSGAGLPSVLSWLASTHRPALARIEEMLNAVVPSVSGVVVEPTRVELAEDARSVGLPPRFVGGHTLRFRVDRAAQAVAASEMSEGTMLVVAILTVCAMPSERTLLLIDDIDRGLHPKAQATLVECLRGVMKRLGFLQIICTTHSPYLLDHFEESEIRVLARTESGVEARRMRTHPDWERLGTSMGAGEFWSTVGEEWTVQ